METSQKLAIRDAGRIDGISSVLLSGEAGTGKTRWAKMLADGWADTFLKYQCHEGTGKEELLYDIDVAGVISALSPHSKTTNTNNNFVALGLLPTACELSQKGQKVVLLLDELEKARQAVDNMLLDFLQSGEIYNPTDNKMYVANTKNLIFVATTNEHRKLSEPLYRRVRRVRLQFPTEKELLQIIPAILHQCGAGEDLEKVGIEKLKFLINLALWYRKQDVDKKITAPEIARLVSDLAWLESKEEKLESLLSWFSPHEDDWKIILSQKGEKYLLGMLK